MNYLILAAILLNAYAVAKVIDKLDAIREELDGLRLCFGEAQGTAGCVFDAAWRSSDAGHGSGD